jgi:SAM-dependent methyltransferase
VKRRHLFEFNDSAFTPRALRDTLIESLSLGLKWGRILEHAVEPFARFLDACGATEVLDVCAGAGQPAALFAREFLRGGRRPPRFVMCDLFPRVEAWRALAAELPDVIGFVEQPVDATCIPPALGKGRARVIVNALHHFPPRVARDILLGAAAEAPGVFVLETLPRNPLHFAAFAPWGLAGMLALPLVTPEQRMKKALWAWLTPGGLATAAWDGTVSALRVYEEADLREMVSPLGEAWAWKYGTFPWGPGGVGRGSYFAGVPRARAV